MTMEFQAFPKIPRLKRDCIITEKIDGTNACIAIDSEGNFHVQSRSRIITPEADNFGFARWAYEHKDELMLLGHGYHYGEWWGAGIQRRYGLTEKRFSLFNTHRPVETLPPCVSQVPVLYKGPFTTDIVTNLVASLAINGSVAAPGFMDPEGVVVYVAAARQMFKVTCQNDEISKGEAANAEA